ncbi:CRISPR-associated nuclease/helicase Cas3 subtype I-F/YPEST [Pseudoalteromonas holothuriae]|uniref:CRISPR-associated nuclease/helicase Cas3 subtype I-F/YPEST n=1 Tax=Pseudoalteromonas holothuriae TaxID=2963714 RepID=A0ABN8UP85_9GAMM|nr:type I-F CRISPR-associated helicase Cas3f [Pseudoalteromonas sp. CIP111951]CAH9064536.1 CRISPR-associated nuclease/helicase Cas3 subtype I-F/YPEST [Pseudoalteromonas sp. CIP111951]
MMVTFVSQCEKNALKKTRRVLDAFANRIGDNTWQTLITEDGLLTVKKMLRKTASRSTAVSCHWIRSRARSQLLWVVGKRSKFDEQGVVPVNYTRRIQLNSDVANDWHFLPLIKALVGVSALFHDWGKATVVFQEKLQPNSSNKYKGDPIRHEWISLLLLRAFIDSIEGDTDQAWLSALSHGELDETKMMTFVSQDKPKPIAGLPPVAKLVAWLIISHHRLPLPKTVEACRGYKSESAQSLDDVLRAISKEWGYENRHDDPAFAKRLTDCFRFPHGLMSNSKPWLSQVKRWSLRLLDNVEQAKTVIANDSYRVVLTHARLCLMLGDHYYSSQQADKKWQNKTGLFANTDRVTRELKQKLDEHLVGVARNAIKTAHMLPAFEREPPQAKDLDNLRKLSPEGYQWQDKAVSKITQWRQTITEQQKQFGFFAVNMASTGCGKTFANAKIMRALSEDAKSLRYILALGLRTLTLQTGDEYRERVGLDSTELAVLIGSRAVMELHNKNKVVESQVPFEHTGSESLAPLLNEDVDFECDIPEEGLTTVLKDKRDKQFLYAPVLACTIDHMMAATETKRGGRYILPTLRLMSSDLVIDEVDDFTGDDLIAIGRLIHLAGMLGRKVMISSATIPPSLAEGYFKAYRDGWLLYASVRSTSTAIGCAWADEFSTQVTTNHYSEDDTPKSIGIYRQEHQQFVNKRASKLAEQPVRRKAQISHCYNIIERHQGQNHHQQQVIISKQAQYFDVVAQSARDKHLNHHFVDTQTQLKVSFGVVRVANIKPCVALTQHLLEYDNWPADTQIRVMAYHSQQVLLMRSIQELHLDQVLKRKEAQGEQPQALSHPVVRTHLNQIAKTQPETQHVMFVLVATPVEEVGRDHDFDWAVIEPSSYRSIIQLAGRVRRHRKEAVTTPNIALLQYNWRAIKHYHEEGNKAYIKPGFENYCRLITHDLTQLIEVEQVAKCLDAIPRICKPEHINAQYVFRNTQAQDLAELEHAAILSSLAYYTTAKEKKPQTSPATMQGWLKHHWFLTALPQYLAPFRKGTPTLKVFLVFDQYSQQSRFCEKDDQGHAVDREDILSIKRIELSPQATARLWLIRDYNQACIDMAEQSHHSSLPHSQRLISQKYGELSFTHNENKHYAYNDQLGLVELSN